MEKNVVFKKNFNRLFWVEIVSSVLFIVTTLVDSALGGSLIEPNAFTAITVCATYCNLVYLVSASTSVGCSILIGDAIGRGDMETANRYHSYFHDLMVIVSLIVAVIGLLFAPHIVRLIGASDPVIAKYAIIYIRVFSLGVFPSVIQYFHIQIMVLLGRGECFVISNIVFLAINLIASLVFVLLFNLGVAGLALGTIAGRTGATLFLIVYVLLCKHPHLTWNLSIHKDFVQKILLIYQKALPTFFNDSTATFSSIIFNNVIAATLGVPGLTAYSVFTVAFSLCNTANTSVAGAVSMSNSVYYGARDVESMRNIIRHTYRLPVIFTFLFTILMTVFRIPILSIFGIKDITLINSLVPGFIFICPIMLVLLFPNSISPFYSTTNRLVLSIVTAIVPDALLYVLFGVPMIELFGISGVWISAFTAGLVFDIIFLGFICIRNKRKIRSVDDIMMLPADYMNDELTMNISIHRTDEAVVGISEKIQRFLLDKGIDSKKAYYAALCLEEMAVIAMDNQKGRSNCFFDLQIFINNGAVKLTLRDDGKSCNYLLYEPEDPLSAVGLKIVRKIAQSVQYTPLIGLNVLNITI